MCKEGRRHPVGCSQRSHKGMFLITVSQDKQGLHRQKDMEELTAVRAHVEWQTEKGGEFITVY